MRVGEEKKKNRTRYEGGGGGGQTNLISLPVNRKKREVYVKGMQRDAEDPLKESLLKVEHY